MILIGEALMETGNLLSRITDGLSLVEYSVNVIVPSFSCSILGFFECVDLTRISRSLSKLLHYTLPPIDILTKNHRENHYVIFFSLTALSTSATISLLSAPSEISMNLMRLFATGSVGQMSVGALSEPRLRTLTTM